MKISQKTLAILKNFATIRDGIHILPGNVLSQRPVEKFMVAYANVDETFPVEANIYSLPLFLQIFSTLEDPELDWKENYVIFSRENHKVTFTYGREIESPPARDKIIAQKWDAEFKLTSEEFGKVMKMANILNSYCIVMNFEGENSKIELEGQSSALETNFSLDVEATVSNEIRVPIRKENILLLPLGYTIKVNEKSVLFENEEFGIMYLVVRASHEHE